MEKIRRLHRQRKVLIFGLSIACIEIHCAVNPRVTIHRNLVVARVPQGVAARRLRLLHYAIAPCLFDGSWISICHHYADFLFDTLLQALELDWAQFFCRAAHGGHAKFLQRLPHAVFEMYTALVRSQLPFCHCSQTSLALNNPRATTPSLSFWYLLAVLGLIFPRCRGHL